MRRAIGVSMMPGSTMATCTLNLDLLGQRLTERFERELGSRVRAKWRRGDASGHPSHVDDAAPSGDLQGRELGIRRVHELLGGHQAA
jgi:hypothetical protein